VQKGTGGWKKIVKAFGDEILLDNGEIDSSLGTNCVFSPNKAATS
jgi:dephospho-CoA kinase